MRYTLLGTRSGIRVSRVSLGAMRFGTETDTAVRTIRAAIDGGVNYIDTSPHYCDDRSESILGEALQDGYRERVYLSSKCSLPRSAKLADYKAARVRRVIDQSLRRLKTDYLDFFQFWLVYSYENYQAMCRKGYHLTAIREAMRDGVVRRTGITGHPPVGDFPRMFANEVFEVCTLSYNYLQPQMRPDIGRLHAMGVGVIVMNPAGGGTLAENSPVLTRLLPGKPVPAVELAYRYVLGTPGVATIIAGMDTAAHADQDCRIADLPPLDGAQRRRIDGRVKDLRRQFDRICTWCNYCKGCPQNIRIPYIFGQYIHLKVLGLRKRARTNYRQYLRGEGWNTGGSPLACTACGACEKKCPNRIPIIRQLKEAHRALAGR
jgi:uncharacterized protein